MELYLMELIDKKARIESLEQRISIQSTIDAVPVEQVARMFALYTEDYPCNFATGYYKSQKDEFCGFNSGCSYESNYDCWLHAIKEGWLDEK